MFNTNSMIKLNVKIDNKVVQVQKCDTWISVNIRLRIKKSQGQEKKYFSKLVFFYSFIFVQYVC